MHFLARIPCRLLAVGALAALATFVVGWARPSEGQFDTGLSRERFWLLKLRAPAQYDMVLTGDSRTLCDLDPASMERVLGGARVLNFGFNVVALTPEYLDSAAAKLDPASGSRTIVVGITPRALTPLNARVSGFDEELHRDWDEKVFNWALNDVNSELRPISPPVAFQRLRGRRVGYKDFFPNGWMSVSLRPPDPTEDLGVYRRIFVGNQVSRAMYEAFLAKVRELSQSGIRIVAVRFPISPELLEQERRSGFDQEAFIRDLEVHGGQWINSPPGSYVITDGSHIDAADAPEYSTRLAARLLPRQRGTPAPSGS